MKKKIRLQICFCMLSLTFVFSCTKLEQASFPLLTTNDTTATFYYELVKNNTTTLRYSGSKGPTTNSRYFAYFSIGLYEIAINSDPSYKSLEGQLQGLTGVPKPEPGKEYSFTIAMIAFSDSLFQSIYTQEFFYDPVSSHQYVLNNLQPLLEKQLGGYSKEVIERSWAFGQRMAAAIFEWSKTDGGFGVALYPFDNQFVFPSGDSYWIPPLRGQISATTPLTPYWGKNRKFVAANETIPVPSIEPFSKDTSSRYYKMYRYVYDHPKPATVEEDRKAYWWADDPIESFSPPGHSYIMASQISRDQKASLVKAAASGAAVAIAVADAFSVCWKAKMTYFNERPSTYLKKHIDATFNNYWPEPPFPAFPSGHSTQSAACAKVLEQWYGVNTPFTDITNSNEYRFFPNFVYIDYTRSYPNFWAAALEAGESRIIGGIHTEQDNLVGLDLGTKVAQNVNLLKWRN